MARMWSGWSQFPLPSTRPPDDPCPNCTEAIEADRLAKADEAVGATSLRLVITRWSRWAMTFGGAIHALTAE